MQRTGPTNISLRLLASRLTKHSNIYKRRAWRAIAKELWKPSRQRVVVNLSKIERNNNKGSIIVVPGVVVGSGRLTKPVSVVAYRFSTTAKKKILSSGGQVLTLDELLERNPRGQGVVIIK
ncbi:MAG: 50S ribosomal protein L18e [Thermoprotei archaeon]